MRICVAGLCVWLCRFVCVMYVYVAKKPPKGGSLHQAIRSGKEIWKHSINRTGEGFQKIVLR